jgi:hypothetical protein
MDKYSEMNERKERERLLRENEKNDMSVSHMSKEEFEEWIRKRNQKEPFNPPARKKKLKKSKAKRCKCK